MEVLTKDSKVTRNLKIACSGAHGVGKTTLVTELAKKLGISPIVDLTRSVPKDRRGTRLGQFEILNAYAKLPSSPWVCDRTLFDVCAYSLDSGAWSFDETHSILRQYHTREYYPDIVFYLPIEFPLIDDGQRGTSREGQRRIDKLIYDFLEAYYPRRYTITGTIEERINKAIAAIA